MGHPSPRRQPGAQPELGHSIDQSPVGIAVSDLETGQVLTVNPRFTALSGSTLKDIPTVDRWFAVRLLAKDRSPRTAVLSTALAGPVAVVTFTDTSEQKRAESALGEPNRSLEETEELAALGRLTTGMAHERGTPLGAILSAGDLVVQIGDSGPGIPEAIRDRIFTPYFTTKRQGEGLGLDLCRRIINDHRGALEFESVPCDTVFTVTLPLHQET